ncbi:MAG TPA: TraR/DksA family transcriptional regulator [Natronosporangium sp.]|nr:TraR/DksA family transcriptional regulator [Natronosporangium sp.]
MAKAAQTTKTSAKKPATKKASAKADPKVTGKAGTKTAAGRGAGGAGKHTRTAAETERIRAALVARREELRREYQQHVADITELQRDRFTDTAGDDQADTGSKTFEREQEISLANSILERSNQVERALERLDEGSYGWCERCGDPIPVERLAAFPSATLCVKCKQLEERR